MLRNGSDLMALVGEATMRELDVRLLDSAAFSIVEVPGDGSCFYSSIAVLEAMDDLLSASGEREFVRVRRQELRRAVAGAFSLLDPEALELIGENREAFIQGTLGTAMADEPTIAMTAKILSRPIIIVDVAGDRKARCYLNTPNRVLNRAPLVLLRRGEHYDALAVQARTKRSLRRSPSI